MTSTQRPLHGTARDAAEHFDPAGFQRQLLAALLEFRDGNFAARLPAGLSGLDGKLAETFNDIASNADRRAREVARVTRMVGKEGLLRERLNLSGMVGSHAEEVSHVNTLIDDLVWPTKEVTRAVGAVAKGDLTQAMSLDVNGRPLEGEFLQSAKLVNTMIDQLSVFTAEVTRVAREVGTEGKLGGQAKVKGVSGVWKDLTESVNQMAGNLTAQVRNIADVTVSVASGDLSKKITVDVRGEILQLKEAINTMVDQLRSFAAEVTRVAREVGTDGKLGGQAVVPGAAGTWKDLTDSVNAMASNLTAQVRNIAAVTTAVARGDLSRKITVDVKGEILELKDTINTMVDQLNAFASEVSRVAREVGTEGKLGGQAEVPGVAGTWKALTDNVNSMASNLTAQVRNIAEVTTAVAKGDLSRKITVDVQGEILELKNTINTMVDQLNAFASEVTRVAREVGTEGKLGGQAEVPGVAGTWKALTDNVNSMASNLTGQVRNIADIATAIARGDLSRKITVDVKGEILQLKNTINTMVDQLNAFAAEVTRVAREVGTDGKLGGQGDVPGVAGTWKDLTDSVNVMAANLTNQVRGIVRVVTAVATGDLQQKLTVEAKGEIAALAETINSMTDTLATFAEQVTNVAREVGVEGRLGGQANVPGAAGTWKDLTGNVNLLAANLTTQVRAIAEVATAVTQGDLSRSIQVDTRGEVSDLKDNINTMIRNLRATTESNQEQDWLKTNLAKFTRMLQGQRDLVTVGKTLLSELVPLVKAQQGAIYQMRLGESDTSKVELVPLATYARASKQRPISLGEGLVGQCAIEQQRIVLHDVPKTYAKIWSGLGNALPTSIVVLPVLFEGETKAVIELASLYPFTPTHLSFLEQLTQSIGVVLNTIEATMRTESLLVQSQQLTTELQTRQTELQNTNEELATKAKQLAEQNAEVERKNQEVEQARRALEEKAAELALTSKYKSEFLANMSHELRTPLNAILLLGQQLADNPGGSLTSKQVEFARNIHSAGTDLLTLITDILDLSKIESGTVTVEIDEVPFASIRDSVQRTFHHVAESKGVLLKLEMDEDLPATFSTDAKRLQQILKNLLSNAFKFTERGEVSMTVHRAAEGWSPGHPVLSTAQPGSVVAFAVTDTGIGIAADKQKLIFEAFHQADAGTSRKYGGTGLGLAISRELASLLGGDIRLTSSPGQGSTFTLYLPLDYAGPSRVPTPSRDPATSGPFLATPILSATRSDEVVPDDRDAITPGSDENILLIVDDDPHYARVLLGLARDKGFKGIVANRGHLALALAREYQPTAITLDLFLPDTLGWSVLSNLKLDPATRHIPVQMISVVEDRQHGLSHGAFSYLVKPATTTDLENALERLKTYAKPHTKRLLVVEDNEIERQGIVELLAHDDIEITAVPTGGEALHMLFESSFDCCVVDLRLPDMSGLDLLERVQTDQRLRDVPIVVFTGKALTTKEEERLKTLSTSVVLKDVQSPERLFDETALFLHRVIKELPPEKQQLLDRLYGSTELLRGERVLVVDDDARNIFALTTLLENEGIEVTSATTGRHAIELIEQTPGISAVLMDIMMPDMDGYTTIREIRLDRRFRSLPIIALTAKAMKGDRERCLHAGASDYIAKPVDAHQLLSLLRVWLHR
ncbi:MAG: hybrid sensor histidine kinase/response regulator [Gemmatimonadetes bacterium]|nr:MAG: hybrid sensor histidine kinase/response regulator [Gemmatimonadota bacterium]